MSTEVVVAIVGGVVTIVTVLSTQYTNYKIEKLHRQINGRMDELLSITGKLNRAQGEKEGKASGKLEERAEVAERKEEGTK